MKIQDPRKSVGPPIDTFTGALQLQGTIARTLLNGSVNGGAVVACVGPVLAAQAVAR
jgi:hypothetical protein